MNFCSARQGQRAPARGQADNILNRGVQHTLMKNSFGLQILPLARTPGMRSLGCNAAPSHQRQPGGGPGAAGRATGAATGNGSAGSAASAGGCRRQACRRRSASRSNANAAGSDHARCCSPPRSWPPLRCGTSGVSGRAACSHT